MNFEDQFNFFDYMKNNNMEKPSIITMCNMLIHIADIFDSFKRLRQKESIQTSHYGMIFTEDFDEDAEDYFGENKIMFYADDSDDFSSADIVEYPEFFTYFVMSVDYFLSFNPDMKEGVEKELA